jgi:uncharacterized RDD family membrane protein YckC/Tfp pilus assembly major pilin PilA
MDENTRDATPQMLPGHRDAPLLHAGFWRRVAAWFIDALILGLFFTAARWIWAVSIGASFLIPGVTTAGNPVVDAWPGLDLRVQASGILAGWLYYALCESSGWQATPGKLALALKVTDEYGRPIGFGRATGRYFGKYVSALIFCIGFLLAGWTRRKQALQDLMAGCCVVRNGGLVAWRRGDSAGPGSPTSPARSVGLPGWGVALIVIVCGVFVVIPAFMFLSAVSITAYRSYTIRAEVAKGVSLSRGARLAVTEYIAKYGMLPEDNAATGLARPRAIRGKYVSSVAVDRGQVVVTYGNQADYEIRNAQLTLVPQGGLNALRWQCRSPDIKMRYLPSQCRP